MVALEIISGIRHLHKYHIIFRDIKPDNIGFNDEGKVKIFDFGLAKELDPKQQCSHPNHDMYTMSGGTGSRRYMAPEVSLSKPYGLSADIYSFAILLWEMLSLEKAYGRLSMDEHQDRVVKGNERPTIPVSWSNSLHDIVQHCWSVDPHQRPMANAVHKQINKEIQSMLVQDFPAQATANKQHLQKKS